jgi:hypothetical protein
VCLASNSVGHLLDPADEIRRIVDLRCDLHPCQVYAGCPMSRRRCETWENGNRRVARAPSPANCLHRYRPPRDSHLGGPAEPSSAAHVGRTLLSAKRWQYALRPGSKEQLHLHRLSHAAPPTQLCHPERSRGTLRSPACPRHRPRRSRQEGRLTRGFAWARAPSPANSTATGYVGTAGGLAHLYAAAALVLAYTPHSFIQRVTDITASI